MYEIFFFRVPLGEIAHNEVVADPQNFAPSCFHSASTSFGIVNAAPKGGA